MSDDVTAGGIAGVVGAVLGWLGGSRGRDASAAKVEAEAMRVQVGSLIETIEALRAELVSVREELHAAEDTIDVLRAEIHELRLRMEER
jgi:chromosome segregation ATPase